MRKDISPIRRIQHIFSSNRAFNLSEPIWEKKSKSALLSFYYVDVVLYSTSFTFILLASHFRNHYLGALQTLFWLTWYWHTLTVNTYTVSLQLSSPNDVCMGHRLRSKTPQRFHWLINIQLYEEPWFNRSMQIIAMFQFSVDYFPR